MNIDWNAKGYQKDFAFVPKYGEAVLDLIDAAPGALAVDLGCGNGGLTGKLIERGYRVVGVDASTPMLALAKERYPDTTFLQADACTFQLPEQADVIFSNAVLHWIDAAKQNELIANIASQLKPGGSCLPQPLCMARYPALGCACLPCGARGCKSITAGWCRNTWHFCRRAALPCRNMPCWGIPWPRCAMPALCRTKRA